MKVSGNSPAYASPVAISNAMMLKYAPANAAPFPAMNSSAAPGDNALRISIAVADPNMLTARYCGLRIHGPLIDRTIKKLENKALRIMSGMAASITGAVSLIDANVSLNRDTKMKALSA